MQSSVSDQQERSQRLQQEMGRRLQEKEQTIKAQKEQVNTDSLTHTHTASTDQARLWQEEARRRVSPCSGYPVFACMGSDCVVLRHNATVYCMYKKRPQPNTATDSRKTDKLIGCQSNE